MNGVEVAKDAAKIILLEKDLAVLNDGVVEGRRCFANIMKYIIMSTSSHFGNMFSMAAASLFPAFLPMLPTQILLNNSLYDTSQVAVPATMSIPPCYTDRSGGRLRSSASS
jgi:Mg2+-importing ATPase